eukprot:tig00000492_g1385.t1
MAAKKKKRARTDGEPPPPPLLRLEDALLAAVLRAAVGGAVIGRGELRLRLVCRAFDRAFFYSGPGGPLAGAQLAIGSVREDGAGAGIGLTQEMRDADHCELVRRALASCPRHFGGLRFGGYGVGLLRRVVRGVELAAAAIAPGQLRITFLPRWKVLCGTDMRALRPVAGL